MLYKIKKKIRYRKALKKVDELHARFYKVLSTYNDIQINNIVDRDLYMNTHNEVVSINLEYSWVRYDLEICGDKTETDIINDRKHTLNEMNEFFSEYFEKRLDRLIELSLGEEELV